MADAESDTNTSPNVTVASGGPYLVKGGMPLQDAQGNEIKTRQNYALCRCGQSAKKPFCDGAHNKAGFSGEETADKASIETRRVVYKGNGISVYDDRSICAHVGICTDDLPNVFRHGQDPWIAPDAEEVQKVLNIVKRCPSGAICYALGESTETVEEEREPGITVAKDGPLEVVGGVEVTSSDGSAYEARARITLCRCGGSKNKPFCDGTHWHIGFKHG